MLYGCQIVEPEKPENGVSEHALCLNELKYF